MFLNKCILFFAQIDSTSFLLVQLFLLPENLKNFSSLSFSCASCAAPPLLLLPQYLLCSCAGITPVPFLACIFFLRFVFSPRCFYWTVSQLLFLFFFIFLLIFSNFFVFKNSQQYLVLNNPVTALAWLFKFQCNRWSEFIMKERNGK